MAVDITGIPPAQPQNGGDGVQGTAADKGQPNPQAAPVAPANTSDTLTLTSQASRLKSIESGIGAQSVIDGQRVQSLKSAIDTGAYEINPLRVAEKFIQFESDIENGLKASR